MTHNNAVGADKQSESETKSMEKRLIQLDCHFTWGVLDGLANIDVANKIDQIGHEVRMNRDVEPQARALMAFLCSQLDPPNWTEATKQVDLAVQSSQRFLDSKDERARGYLAVALADAAHIAFLQNQPLAQVDNLLQAAEALKPVGETGCIMAAGVLGNHGYALSVMDKSKHVQGLKLFRQAYALDQTCFEWPMGAAILAGRVRRLAEGPQSLPTRMELELLRQAVHLSDSRKALPIVLFADVLFTLGRRYAGSTFPEDKDVLNEAKALYLQALQLAPDSTPVLKRCGKAFSILGDTAMAERCLLRAVELDPSNSVIMHRLGQTYEFCLSDLGEARKCYSQAITLEKRRNLFAELDLARVCKKQDHKYDLDKHLQAMRPHYVGDERAQQQLEAAIKRQEAHQRQWLHSNRVGHQNHSRPAASAL